MDGKPGLYYPPDRPQPDEVLGLTPYETKVSKKLNEAERKALNKYKRNGYSLVGWGKGYPDFMFKDKHGRLLFIEVKRDYDKLSEDQQDVLKSMKEAGLEVGVEHYASKTGKLERRDYLIE